MLIKHVQNGRNVALISPRRLGKSGLISHLLLQPTIAENYYTFYVDIYSTRSLSELVYELSKEIHKQLQPSKTPWSEQFFKVLTSLRVGFILPAASSLPSGVCSRRRSSLPMRVPIASMTISFPTGWRISISQTIPEKFAAIHGNSRKENISKSITAATGSLR